MTAEHLNRTFFTHLNRTWKINKSSQIKTQDAFLPTSCTNNSKNNLKKGTSISNLSIYHVNQSLTDYTDLGEKICLRHPEN